MILVVKWLRVNGMALWPFILVSSSYHKHNVRLINHERIHHRQQLELLVLPFYVLYISYYLYYLVRYLNHYQAYMAIPFECEAYKNDHRSDYLTKRPLFAFTAYL